MIITIDQETIARRIDAILQLAKSEPIAAYRRADTLLRWVDNMPDEADRETARHAAAWMMFAVSTAASERV